MIAWRFCACWSTHAKFSSANQRGADNDEGGGGGVVRCLRVASRGGVKALLEKVGAVLNKKGAFSGMLRRLDEFRFLSLQRRGRGKERPKVFTIGPGGDSGKEIGGELLGGVFCCLGTFLDTRSVLVRGATALTLQDCRSGFGIVAQSPVSFAKQTVGSFCLSINWTIFVASQSVSAICKKTERKAKKGGDRGKGSAQGNWQAIVDAAHHRTHGSRQGAALAIHFPNRHLPKPRAYADSEEMGKPNRVKARRFVHAWLR